MIIFQTFLISYSSSDCPCLQCVHCNIKIKHLANLFLNLIRYFCKFLYHNVLFIKSHVLLHFFDRFLVQDHNAVIDVLTLRKQTPLNLGAAAGQLEVCRLLLELGANIDATDDQGQKPIHAAAQNNFSEVVQLFLQQHSSLVMAYTKVFSITFYSFILFSES